MWAREFDVAAAVEALKDFAGVRRRFDRVGEAGGITIVDDIEYIERGYESFEEKLSSLGAMMEKVSSEKEIQKFRLKVG